jgi:hypothetical protein
LVEQYGERLQMLEDYPQGALVTLIEPIRHKSIRLSWSLHTGGQRTLIS